MFISIYRHIAIWSLLAMWVTACAPDRAPSPLNQAVNTVLEHNSYKRDEGFSNQYKIQDFSSGELLPKANP